MRFSLSLVSKTALVAAAAFALAAPAGSAFAQDAKPAAAAPAADAQQPKQLTLTQSMIDGLIGAQKEIRDIDAKAPKDAKKPDTKLETQVDAAVKKNGFASVDQFADASYSVGIVLAGLDPETNKYVGSEAATKKQIDAVKADTKMPPKEKKEALDELNESLKQIPNDKPPQANIDLVTTNLPKLNEGLKQAD